MMAKTPMYNKVVNTAEGAGGYHFSNKKQVRIHDIISRERWAGALMEVRSLLSLNSAVKKNARPTTDGRTDGRTHPNIESLVRD